MSFSNIYILDFRKLIIWLLPTFLRKVKHVAWLDTLCAPLKETYEAFLKYRTKVNYKLSNNSQVCYLQAVLNDSFDKQLRRIIIENGIFLQALYVYAPEEQLPVYIDTQYIYSDEDLAGGQTDFVIKVPKDLKPSDPIALEGLLSDIKAITNEYKLASKTYTIQWTE